MLKNSIKEFGYVRVSTNNTSQLSSLETQYNTLKEKKCEIFSTIQSGKKSIPNDFKEKVIKSFGENNDVQINITAFNRLTRNFGDLDFIYKYISYIFVEKENKKYDVKTNISYISLQIQKAVDEHTLIIEKLKNKSICKKRSRTFVLLDRCEKTLNIMKTGNINNEQLNDLKNIIIMSQNLNCIEDWNNFINIIEKYGIDIEMLKREFRIVINKLERKIKQYEIKKKDIAKIIYDICQVNNFVVDKLFINKFINANIRYGQSLT